MLKKEDYMRLPKERLAEMLVERDNQPTYIPAYPQSIPFYNMWCPLTGGACTNPHHDCYNCPHHSVTAGYQTTAECKLEEDKPTPNFTDPDVWPNVTNCFRNCSACMAKCMYRKAAYKEENRVIRK